MSITVQSTTDTPESVVAHQKALDEGKKRVEMSDVATKEVTEKAEKSDDSVESKEETLELNESEETEDSSDESEETEKPKKKKGGFQKRIERYQKQMSAKDLEIQALMQELGKFKAEKPVEKIEKVVEGKPKPESFDTHEEYIEALTDWKLETKEKETQTKLKLEKEKTQLLSKVDTFKQKIAEFSKTYSDFNEVVEDVEHIPLSKDLRELILDSDLSAHLSYELAKNEDELVRINSLPPLAMAKEIGKLEDKISSKYDSSPKEKKTTKAPAPLTPVSGSSKGSKSPNEMSFQEYKAWRAAN